MTEHIMTIIPNTDKKSVFVSTPANPMSAPAASIHQKIDLTFLGSSCFKFSPPMGFNNLYLNYIIFENQKSTLIKTEADGFESLAKAILTIFYDMCYNL